MIDGKWEFVVLSDVDYENLITEVIYDGKLVALLDTEAAPNIVSISVPQDGGGMSEKILLSEFLVKLEDAGKDLCR